VLPGYGRGTAEQESGAIAVARRPIENEPVQELVGRR
jgi:hypothetical protein